MNKKQITKFIKLVKFNIIKFIHEIFGTECVYKKVGNQYGSKIKCIYCSTLLEKTFIKKYIE